ncbi:hypothetical protein FLONG3_7852 [Fusarium longipes]|uniref:DUF7730 domain-containing protein n=1 Tax=Fusarium longipes TaxID=694270 RepID=A0A395S9X3_9HYPO|nr:hypothetical protein FLONG3_7852 [Fusarium longipes]
MRRHLKAWISKRRSKREIKTEVDSSPEMPYLPNPRPRVLTPSSSMQDLSLPLQTCPIFRELPSEIRRQILVFAFGDRTVHMDLVREHPTKPEVEDPGCGYSNHAKYGEPLDKNQPEFWKWKGCVCHRVAPPALRKAWYRDEHTLEPADDECCSGQADLCALWLMHYGTLRECFVGAMGWLLACRQSYVEGLDVLYRTNTLHLSSKPLILNLPKLIIPQRISMVTSLEVVWLIDSKVHSGVSIPQQGDLDEILGILDLHFPRLHRLKLAIKLRLYAKIPVQLDEMINTLDAFVARRVQHLQEPITISLASWAFEQLYGEVVRKKQPDTTFWQDYLRYKLWRDLNGKYAFASRIKVQEKYGQIDGITAQNGYWFRLGDDKTRSIITLVIGCFGSGGGMWRDGRFASAPIE